MTKILFLYAEMVPSWMPTFAILANQGVSLHVVHWDKTKKTPYTPPDIDGVTFYKRSNYNQESLNEFVNNLQPDLIFISGWMDREYIAAAHRARLRRVPVVSGFDDWWTGSVRQRIASLIPAYIRRSYISHAWVAGPRQYEYAKRLGFSDSEIIYNLLTCDTKLFYEMQDSNCLEAKNVFIYVGRFSPEKGIKTLVDGFALYRENLGGTWSLRCVGNGPLEHLLRDGKGIKVLPFMKPEELRQSICSAGAFVVPSDRDFHPLVVHEACCAGKPLVLSSNVGSIPTFAINKYNSYIFEVGSAKGLSAAFKAMEDTTPAQRAIMGENSKKLSFRNSPEVCAASLLSII